MFASIAEGSILSYENFRKIFGIDNYHSTRENFMMQANYIYGKHS